MTKKDIIAQDTGRKINLDDYKQPQRTKLRKKPPQADSLEAAPKEQTSKTPLEQEDNKVAMESPIKASDNEKVLITPQSPEEKITFETVEFDDSGDFSALFNESLKEEGQVTHSINLGDKVQGKVAFITNDYIFLSLGNKLEGFIPISEVDSKSFSVGDTITAYVTSLTDGVCLSTKISAQEASLELLTEAHANKIPVQGKITGLNKGGYDVMIGNKRAFCPISGVSNKFVTDPKVFVGQTLEFIVEKIEENGRNIVVNRRILLEAQAKVTAQETLKTLQKGDIVSGTVVKICEFGAFVDVGGIEGLIPKSQLSHGYVDKVSDVLSTQDVVKVYVDGIEENLAEPTKSKLNLSLKKSGQDPYALHWEKIKTGVVLEGKVVRMETYGAFVELFEGIDGLLHISEICEERINHPSDVLSLMEPVSCIVTHVDQDNKRISLSLRDQKTKKAKGQKESLSANITKGQKACGTVSRIENYGVFLELDIGVTALLPRSQMDLPRHSDINKAYNIGHKLDVVVIDVDNNNRVKVSSTDRKELEERTSFLEFQAQQNQSTPTFGTLFDVLKGKK